MTENRIQATGFKAAVVLAAAAACAVVTYGAVTLKPFDPPGNYFDWFARPAQEGVQIIPLLKDRRVSLRFTAPVDGLIGFRLWWATYARVNSSTLVIQLKDLDSGRVVRQGSFPASEIQDWDWHDWWFGPIPGSAGRAYELTWSSPDADERNCLAFVTVADPGRHRAALVVDGRLAAGSYPALRLSAEPKPPWLESWSFWAAVLLDVLVLAFFVPAGLRFGFGRTVKLTAFTAAPSVILLVSLEVGLRLVFGLPSGLFSGLCGASGLGLFPPNATINMTYGPIEYVIKTNSLGFRGREFSPYKPPKVFRILAVGDSYTIGFYVDNECAYPQILEDLLRAENGRRIEVVNFAKGGGSIVRHYRRLINQGLRLDPDLVLLQFYANDIPDMAAFRPEDLPEPGKSIRPAEAAPSRSIQCLLADTAVGEAVMDLYLRLRYRQYRSGNKDNAASADPSFEGRRPEPGEIERNLELFRTRFDDVRAVLHEPLSPTIERQINDYLYVLAKIGELCRERGVPLALLYVPTYQQIYDPAASLKIQEMLTAACRELGVAFIDLTEEFIREAGDRVIHFAPEDHHFNCAGNFHLARLAAGHLDRLGLVAAGE